METENSEEDVKPEDVKKPARADFLKEARELAEKNEKAVEQMRELVERNEELAARNILGGKSERGEEPEKKEETPSDYVDRIERGEY